MSDGKRSFATKILKQSNAEVRRQVASIGPNDPVPKRPDSSLSYFSEVLLSDVVDPVNFEEYLEDNLKILSEDPHKDLYSFPSDDIDVCIIPRKVRTVRPILPDYNDLTDQEDPYVIDCIRCYTSNWVVVVKKYENKLSRQDKQSQRLTYSKRFSRPQFEIDGCVSKSKDTTGEDSPDKTPNAHSPSQSGFQTLERKFAALAFEKLSISSDPPLASDEETSDGSPTPPMSKRQSTISTCSTMSTKTFCAVTDDPSSRNSWHYIDSPCNSVFIDSNRNSAYSTMSRDSRASRIFDLRNSQSDPLVHEVLLDTLEDIDATNEKLRQEASVDALLGLSHIDEETSLVDLRRPAIIPSEHFGNRIYAKCLTLKLDLEIEPIFASLALYDAKEKKKLSENFYFDTNHEHMKRMLSMHIPYQDISTLSRSCIFDVTYPSTDMFLVLKLEKVLQGDITESLEPYLKDDKNKEKLRSNASLCCEKLGKYRQPFGWTAIHLLDVFLGTEATQSLNGSTSSFSEINEPDGSLDRRSIGSDSIGKRLTDSLNRKGSLERPRSDKQRSWSQDELAHAIQNFHPVTLTINNFFKQDYEKMKDEDLYKMLQELKRPSSALKRTRCISGVFKLELTPRVSDTLKYCLTPELVRINPYPDDQGRPTKELVEFPPKSILKPYYHYRNLLFVYPKSINFSNRQGSARNITCKVQLMAGEDDFNVLNSVFGKSSCPEFLHEAFSSISYHNKCPDFGDEIKVKLPAKLLDQHHLLFTFYHISCQRTKQNEPTSSQAPVGWTWLPLYRDGRLQTGDFSLPVMLEKPPASYSFLTPFIQIPNTKWIDNHKEIFNVSIMAESSVHPQDSCLYHFLQLAVQIEEQNIPNRYQSNIETEFKSSILCIANAQTEQLVKFFTVVMNKLIRLMVRPPVYGGNQMTNISQTAFEAMTAIVERISSISDKNSRNDILSTFVHYQCLFPHPDNSVLRPVNPDVDSAEHVSRTKPAFSPASQARSTSNPNVVEAKTIKSPNVERAYSLRSPTTAVNGSANIEQTKSQVHQRKLFHEELLLQWVVSNGSARELALHNAYFFFDLIIKSATEYLAIFGQLNSERKDRFSVQFIDDLLTLVNLIALELTNKLKRETKDMKLIASLNVNLAFFLRDLFSIADRGFIFSLIRMYLKHLSGSSQCSESAKNLKFSLRIDFLRVVCSHEHYVQLNLPFNSPLFQSNQSSESKYATINSHKSIFSQFNMFDRICSFAELSEEFRRQHFLAGLVLSHVSSSLEMNNPVIQSKALGLLKSLLTSHEWDDRYKEQSVREHIAALYVPLILIVIDALPQLESQEAGLAPLLTNGKTGTLKRQSEKLKAMSTVGENAATTPDSIDQSIAAAIAGSSCFTNDPGSGDSYEAPKRSPIDSGTAHELLICFSWVLKSASKNLLNQLFCELSFHRLSQLIEVLEKCISMFEYKGKLAPEKSAHMTLRKNSDLKSKLEEAILGLGSARRELMLRRRDRNPVSQSFSPGDTLRWRKNLQTRYSLASNQTREEVEAELILGGHLATQINLIALNSLEDIVKVVSQDNDVSSDNLKQSQMVVASALQLIIEALSLNQSTQALQCIFATQRSLIKRFPTLIFDEQYGSELCTELCLQLLKHCSSSIGSNRAQAAASLYSLMRQNYGSTSNFAKIKMQVTMSLSSLVGTSQTFSEQCLRRSLKTILVYAVVDKDFQETNFPEQVQELIFNLHMILSDTIRMKEYQEDPEMLLDIMYRIAKGYQNSPDLRLTWLASMAQKHAERGNHTEAAQCYVHGAAMVAEYLHCVHNRSYLPVSCVAFQRISVNILEESSYFKETPADKEGMCTGKSFTDSGLVALLEKAASAFSVALMYEAVNEVYKLITPIAEAQRDYRKLASIHGKLQDVFTKIEQHAGKRVFGTYFRVGFYGAKYGDLDGEEFVYKEPYLTKLPEIAQRLESFYSVQFGADYVEVIKDSNAVDVSKLEPDKVYIQITYVEPYFDTWELENRQTSFERNYNIKRFLYSTPFCPDGRAHGELCEQFKRKTILTTVNSFPYVKTRVQVQDRQQVILTPIEVAIEDIIKKTKELANATYQDNVDPKILQMVLQGCIGTTVNQGPLEVANVFLSDSSKLAEKPTQALENRLKACFKDFCKKCGDALRKNRTLIGPDQKEYQRELERNFHRFTEKLAPMISNNSAAALRKLRESYWNYNSSGARHKTSQLI
ncbi:Dedicator of cytokinesis protein 7 [Halotydeus destructor]|nr:Dedicator of cytokinesis protein 7 [Halotydeus destructor]